MSTAMAALVTYLPLSPLPLAVPAGALACRRVAKRRRYRRCLTNIARLEVQLGIREAPGLELARKYTDSLTAARARWEEAARAKATTWQRPAPPPRQPSFRPASHISEAVEANKRAAWLAYGYDKHGRPRKEWKP